MKILYFAWLKEKVGFEEEDATPPADVHTVGQLIDWLIAQGPGHASAFENRDVIRAAVNQDFAEESDPVRPDDEVAFFPPVTGG